MLTDIKQNELDIAEERLFNNLFGSTVIDSKTQWLLNFFNIDINKSIQNFENFMKPILLDDGLVNANMLRDLIRSKHPMLAGLVPTSNFRLVDVADDFSNVIKVLLKGIKQ